MGDTHALPVGTRPRTGKMNDKNVPQHSHKIVQSVPQHAVRCSSRPYAAGPCIAFLCCVDSERHKFRARLS